MYHDELVQVAQTVWESMLQLELLPAKHARRPAAEDLAARVDIGGAWRGSVVTSCPSALAAKLAGILLQAEPDRVLAQHVCDALAEIANMLGGGIKALFPAPCTLSLPSVFVWGSAPTEETFEVLDRVCFDCQGDTFSVELRRYPIASAT